MIRDLFSDCLCTGFRTFERTNELGHLSFHPKTSKKKKKKKRKKGLFKKFFFTQKKKKIKKKKKNKKKKKKKREERFIRTIFISPKPKQIDIKKKELFQATLRYGFLILHQWRPHLVPLLLGLVQY